MCFGNTSSSAHVHLLGEIFGGLAILGRRVASGASSDLDLQINSTYYFRVSNYLSFMISGKGFEPSWM
jgi:hypothetical protein